MWKAFLTRKRMSVHWSLFLSALEFSICKIRNNKELFAVTVLIAFSWKTFEGEGDVELSSFCGIFQIFSWSCIHYSGLT